MLLARATTGDSVAMMANSDQGLAVMTEVLSAVASEYAWEGFPGAVKLATLPAARLTELAGAYQVHDDRVIRLAVDGDHLALRTPFLPPSALLPSSDSTFVSREDPTRYAFSKEADGQIKIQISPPPGDWPFDRRVADAFTVPLDDVGAGRIDQAAERYRAARVNALAKLKALGAAP